MSALDKIKAEIVAKQLETGEVLDNWTLHVSYKLWRGAAKEIGIKTRGLGIAEVAFIVNKVRVEAQWTLKVPRWSQPYKSGAYSAFDAVLKQTYMPAIKQMLNDQSLLKKWIAKNEY